MVTKPTTLILGAGASAPFGFPTGNALLQKALSWANVEVGRTNPHIFRGIGIEKPKIDLFREALSKSGTASVDSFLEHRPEFLDIGKAVIALELIGCEQEHKLFEHNETNWYQYLFNELNTNFDDFNKNKLSILTFNYDRSLEHYLLTALHHKYNKPMAECAEKLKSIPIIHLHGDLGGLPYLDNNLVRPYSKDINNEIVQIATERIKIIHEGFDNAPQFALAQKILRESHYICFLGFGYHHLNIKRLGFKDAGGYAFQANLLGSTQGFTFEERKHLTGRFQGQLKFESYPRAIDHDVLSFLRETNILRVAS
jgi:hypothetical protein